MVVLPAALTSRSVGKRLRALALAGALQSTRARSSFDADAEEDALAIVFLTNA